MVKVMVELNNMNKVYLLENFGKITYVDDFSNVVFLEINQQDILNISELPFVNSIKESGRGTLLAV